MSIDAIKKELAGLDDDKRHQIMAFLIAIEDGKNPEYMAAMARKIDDKDPSHWLTLEEFEKKLSLSKDERGE
jgi:hypothetical protein